MTIGSTHHLQTDSRKIEIETNRILDRQQTHYGVIDIGSNSIRLVVYDELSRAPFPRFNEKSMVALGSGIDAEGRFSSETISRALDAVQRLSAIARAMTPAVIAHAAQGAWVFNGQSGGLLYDCS